MSLNNKKSSLIYLRFSEETFAIQGPFVSNYKQRYSLCSQAQAPGSYALGRYGPRQRPQLGDWNFSPCA